MNTTQPADPNVFEDTDRSEINLTEKDLLGTHTFQNVLYTGQTNVVDITTGETPKDLDRAVKDAKEFAKDTTSEDRPPRIAKAQPAEQAVESRSPYVSSAFFHMDITGGYEWHTVFRKAWESDAYSVNHDADYVTGTLTITVEKTVNQ